MGDSIYKNRTIGLQFAVTENNIVRQQSNNIMDRANQQSSHESEKNQRHEGMYWCSTILSLLCECKIFLNLNISGNKFITHSHCYCKN